MLVATFRSVDGGWQESEYSNTLFNRIEMIKNKEFKDLYDTKTKTWLKKDFAAVQGGIDELH